MLSDFKKLLDFDIWIHDSVKTLLKTSSQLLEEWGDQVLTIQGQHNLLIDLGNLCLIIQLRCSILVWIFLPGLQV